MISAGCGVWRYRLLAPRTRKGWLFPDARGVPWLARVRPSPASRIHLHWSLESLRISAQRGNVGILSTLARTRKPEGQRSESAETVRASCSDGWDSLMSGAHGFQVGRGHWFEAQMLQLSIGTGQNPARRSTGCPAAGVEILTTATARVRVMQRVASWVFRNGQLPRPSNIPWRGTRRTLESVRGRNTETAGLQMAKPDTRDAVLQVRPSGTARGTAMVTTRLVAMERWTGLGGSRRCGVTDEAIELHHDRGVGS